MSPQRPIGFSPSEISALVNETVVSQHADEASFLWTLRNRAVAEPHFSLYDLAALDERLEAHLDGLRVAGQAGWHGCVAAPPGPGETFALAVVAFRAGDREWMRHALNIGCESAVMKAGLISALGWIDYGTISTWIRMLVESRSAVHRHVGIATLAIQRQDPGDALAFAIQDQDPVLRARALRAVGELKRRDLLNRVREHLTDEDATCRFWSAWALSLHREPDGLVALAESIERRDAFSQPALGMCLRAFDPDESRRWISWLAQEPVRARSAVTGAGIVGDPTAIPWLIRRMESPELARIAAEAFMMITGVDLAYADLDQDADGAEPAEGASPENELELSSDDNLPWPAPALVSRWWEVHQRDFSLGTRYLAGKPLTAQTALDVLLKGRQRQRVAAALELALLDRDAPLFETRAVGSRQLQLLRAPLWP